MTKFNYFNEKPTNGVLADVYTTIIYSEILGNILIEIKLWVDVDVFVRERITQKVSCTRVIEEKSFPIEFKLCKEEPYMELRSDKLVYRTSDALDSPYSVIENYKEAVPYDKKVSIATFYSETIKIAKNYYNERYEGWREEGLKKLKQKEEFTFSYYPTGKEMPAEHSKTGIFYYSVNDENNFFLKESFVRAELWSNDMSLNFFHGLATTSKLIKNSDDEDVYSCKVNDFLTLVENLMSAENDVINRKEKIIKSGTACLWINTSLLGKVKIRIQVLWNILTHEYPEIIVKFLDTRVNSEKSHPIQIRTNGLDDFMLCSNLFVYKAKDDKSSPVLTKRNYKEVLFQQDKIAVFEKFTSLLDSLTAENKSILKTWHLEDFKKFKELKSFSYFYYPSGLKEEKGYKADAVFSYYPKDCNNYFVRQTLLVALPCKENEHIDFLNDLKTTSILQKVEKDREVYECSTANYIKLFEKYCIK